MIKIILNNKKALIITIIILLLIGYYIYDINSNTHTKLSDSSETDELLIAEQEQKDKNEIDEKVQEDEEIIIVHITGEVKNWGVIELEENSRIIDAVNKAGGFTDNADVDKVNLAYVLTDGVKIYIPSKDENIETNIDGHAYITEESGDTVILEESEMKKSEKTLVNINNATQTELETLPGIGPSIALKIITYRQENGNFTSIDDIKNVSGIGDSKFNSIKELICV